MKASLANPVRAAGLLAAGLLAIAAGWLLAEMSELGFKIQAAVVAGAIVVPVAIYLYLTKPHVVVNAYIFVVPFLISDPEGTGVNVGEVVSLAVVLGGLPLLLLMGKRVTGSVRTIVLAFLALGVLGAASIVVNSVATLPNFANGAVKYMVLGLTAALLYAFNDTEEKAEGLMKVLVASGVGIALFSVFEYATGRSYFPEYGYSRASGTFEHWNELGGYMALVSFPTLMFALRTRNLTARVACFFGWIVELVALLLSLTLGAVAGLAIGALAGAVLYFRRGVVKTLTGALVGVGILTLVWQTVPEVRTKFEAADTRVDDRFATYITGFYALRDNFWLGVGAQSEVLDAVLESNRIGPNVSVVPHNAFLALGVEKGIAGPVLLLVVVVAALRTVIGKKRHFTGRSRLLLYGIGMGSIAFLAQNMTNLLLLHARLAAVWIAFHVAATRLRDHASANAG